MKKIYKTPTINYVFVEDTDLICTSGLDENTGGEFGGEGDGSDTARERRNAIWDD